MIDSNLEDWQVALTWHRVYRISIEFVVCVIHPYPGLHDGHQHPHVAIEANGTDSNTCQAESPRCIKNAPLDAWVSLIMFLRLYLMMRVIVMHNPLFESPSSQSLGALNHVHLNNRFIFKGLMTVMPVTILTSLIVFILLWASWSFRVCEYEIDPGEFHNQGGAKWIVIRRSLCGRNGMPCGRPAPGRPIDRSGFGRPQGIIAVF
jgi:hypothetical protein